MGVGKEREGKRRGERGRGGGSEAGVREERRGGRRARQLVVVAGEGGREGINHQVIREEGIYL